MKRSPIRRRARTKHQEANVQHREYVAWIHTQPCAACGTRQAIQAAHVGQGGMGMKHGSDAECIPLCGPRTTHGHNGVYSKTIDGCHQQRDQYKGQFSVGVNWSSRTAIRAWDAHQVAVHRGRFEARNVGAQVVQF